MEKENGTDQGKDLLLFERKHGYNDYNPRRYSDFIEESEEKTMLRWAVVTSSGYQERWEKCVSWLIQKFWTSSIQLVHFAESL